MLFVCITSAIVSFHSAVVSRPPVRVKKTKNVVVLAGCSFTLQTAQDSTLAYTDAQFTCV